MQHVQDRFALLVAGEFAEFTEKDMVVFQRKVMTFHGDLVSQQTVLGVLEILIAADEGDILMPQGDEVLRGVHGGGGIVHVHTAGMEILGLTVDQQAGQPSFAEQRHLAGADDQVAVLGRSDQ